MSAFALFDDGNDRGIEREAIVAIAKKHKRKLICRDGTYYWWVKRDDDYDRPILHIASEDKKLVVLYPVEQSADRRYLVSIGRVFKGREMDGRWHRFRLPELGCGKALNTGQGAEKTAEPAAKAVSITPGFVSQLLCWCIDEGETESVAWNGRDIWL